MARELSFPGTFVPWNFRTQEYSLPGTFAPWNLRSLLVRDIICDTGYILHWVYSDDIDVYVIHVGLQRYCDSDSSYSYKFSRNKLILVVVLI